MCAGCVCACPCKVKNSEFTNSLVNMQKLHYRNEEKFVSEIACLNEDRATSNLQKCKNRLSHLLLAMNLYLLNVSYS